MLNKYGKCNSKNPWIKKHLNDPFVKKAHDQGYRSRAALKLIEIEDKFSLIKKANTICDIGSAPGGWSQVISEIFNKQKTKIKNQQVTYKIIAVDLLEMQPIKNVDFIKGDFTSPEINKLLQGVTIDLIVSDMAPNTCGSKDIDHIRSMNLCLTVLEFAKTNLQHQGNLIIKIFSGQNERDLVDAINQTFEQVQYFKPKASRSESKETYLIGLNKKIN